MPSKKQIFTIVLILLATSIILINFVVKEGSPGRLIVSAILILASGVWILLRKRIIGEEKTYPRISFSPPATKVSDQISQPVSERSYSANNKQTVGRLEGINSLLECTREDIMDITDQWTAAVDDLQLHKEEGSRSLANLLEEMLRCRADKIGTVIAMSRNLLPTQELIASLNAIRSAIPVVPAIAGARFRPQIEGSGMIGWTDGTAAHIQTAAAEALSLLGKPPLSVPDIGKLENERDVPGLMDALTFRTDMRLRAAAASAIGDIGDRQALEALEMALKDDVSPVRMAAAEALGKIGEMQSVKPLLEVLRKSDMHAAASAAEALGKLGDTNAVEPLCSVLRYGYRDLGKASAEALGKLRDERAVEPLTQALKDKYFEVRKAAAEALGLIGDGRAVEPLKIALKDEDGAVRSAAAEALSRLKST